MQRVAGGGGGVCEGRRLAVGVGVGGWCCWREEGRVEERVCVCVWDLNMCPSQDTPKLSGSIRRILQGPSGSIESIRHCETDRGQSWSLSSSSRIPLPQEQTTKPFYTAESTVIDRGWNMCLLVCSLASNCGLESRRLSERGRLHSFGDIDTRAIRSW